MNAALVLTGVIIVSNHVEANRAEWERQQFTRRVCETPGRIPAAIRCAIWLNTERPGLIAAVAYQESRFNPTVCSKKQACGLMQFLERTATEEGINRFDPAEAARGGEQYLKKLEKRFGNLGLGLAAYNFGPGNVSKWLKAGADVKALPAETRDYVLRISGHSIEDWLKGRPGPLRGHVASLAAEFTP
jgi:soluble lytic murein transglycosylase-like protein